MILPLLCSDVSRFLPFDPYFKDDANVVTNSRPGRETLAFKVGPQQQDFPVHKELIRHYSPVFEAALTSDDGATSLTTLPDVKAETFELFNDWVYTQTLWDAKDQIMRAADEPKLEALLELYIYADTLNINELKNKSIDAFMLVWNEHQDLPTGNIKDLWKKISSDSPLRFLIRDTIAFGFTPAEVRACWDDLPSDLQLDVVQKLTELVEQYEINPDNRNNSPFDHPERYYV